MKRKQRRIFAAFAVFFFVILVVSSAAEEIGWYFKKNNEHKQPPLDEGLSFISNYKCYYVDKSRGDECADKVIYLTFDAGYENGNIERILDTLKEKDVKGAFFVLGHLIEANTPLVKRMADEGHLVCNHTMTHKNMAKVSERAEFEKELLELERLYSEKIGGEMPKFYRPPEGRFSSLYKLKDVKQHPYIHESDSENPCHCSLPRDK